MLYITHLSPLMEQVPLAEIMKKKWLLLTIAAGCIAALILFIRKETDTALPRAITADSTDILIANKNLLGLNIPDDGRFTLVLDAGHGGKDDGAVGDSGRLMEKDYALAIVKIMKPILDRAGIKTMLTRSNDSFLNPIDRTILIQQYHADLLVSIHGNFIDDRWAKTLRGIEVYYDSANIYLNESRQLAETVFTAMKNIDSVPARRVMRKDAGIYILRNALCPAILVEAGYLTHPAEVKQLEKKLVQHEIAEALSKTIIQYAAVQQHNKNLYDAPVISNHKLWLVQYPDSIKDNAVIMINNQKADTSDLYRLNIFDEISETFTYTKNNNGTTVQTVHITIKPGSKTLLRNKIEMSLGYAFINNKRNTDKNKLFYKFSYCKPNGETWVYVGCSLYNKETAALNFFDKYPLYIINGNRMPNDKMKEAMNKDYKTAKACRAIEEGDLNKYFAGNTSKYSGAFILDKSDAAIDSILAKKVLLP